MIPLNVSRPTLELVPGPIMLTLGEAFAGMAKVHHIAPTTKGRTRRENEFITRVEHRVNSSQTGRAIPCPMLLALCTDPLATGLPRTANCELRTCATRSAEASAL